MSGRVAHAWVAVFAVLSACWVTGCDDLYQRSAIADDSPRVVPVDAGTFEDVLREAIVNCRLILSDAGRPAGPPTLDYCSLGLFFEGCPLRVCVEQLAIKLRPHCPERDSGLDSLGSRICEEVVWPILPDEP